MNRWAVDRAIEWHKALPWLIGCNFIPSTAINQLEMWQAETYDPETIDKELGRAEDLGFNTLRVFLHDLVWHDDPDGFAGRIDGSQGAGNIAMNFSRADVITFHCYSGEALEQTILRHKVDHSGRPVICTEYMARERGTTFEHSLPIFRTHRIGCCNWGLVAGKSQTHFNWQTVEKLPVLRHQGARIHDGDPIPEPLLWFHDIFRTDGTPFDRKEVDFIKSITGTQHIDSHENDMRR